MRLSPRWIIALALIGVAGSLLLIAAQRFDRPEPIGPGPLLFALGVLTAGAHTILSRYGTAAIATVRADCCSRAGRWRFNSRSSATSYIALGAVSCHMCASRRGT